MTHLFSHGSEGQRSDMGLTCGAKIQVWAGQHSSNRLQGRMSFPAFPASSGPRIPQHLTTAGKNCPPSSKAAMGHDPASILTAPDHSWESFCDFKDPCEDIGPTWITQENFPSQGHHLNHVFKGPLPCELHNHRCWGLE